MPDLSAPGTSVVTRLPIAQRRSRIERLYRDPTLSRRQWHVAPAHWKATTEKPAVENGVESYMIFRNPAKDLLRLDMRDFRSRKQTRVTLKHQSAAEVEETGRQVKLAIEAKKKKEEEESSGGTDE